MVRQRLWEVQQDAAALYDTLRDDDRVPAWTLDKVATGGDRIGQVSRYLRFKARNPIQWGAPDVGAKRDPWGTIKVFALFGGALIAATALMAFAAKSLDTMTPVPTKPKRKKRRPTYYAF
jgi:hypothetical protein